MPVKLLNLDLTSQIKELFETQLLYPVELLYFYADKDACDTCDDTRQLLDEISSLSDKLYLRIFNINEDLDAAKQYNVVLTPGLVIAGGGDGEPVDHGIRFAGIPSGYEFGSLIQTIILVSKRDSGLQPAIRRQLRDLKNPIHLQVFVTPT